MSLVICIYFLNFQNQSAAGNVIQQIKKKSLTWTEDMRRYTRSRITRTRLYQIIAYVEGHLPHQKSLH